MHSYYSSDFTIFYNSDYSGNIIIANTKRDQQGEIIVTPTVELNISVEYIEKIVNLYIDLHGYNAMDIPIEGPLQEDGNTIGKMHVSLQELTGFIADMELKNEIIALDSLNFQQSIDRWLRNRHKKN